MADGSPAARVLVTGAAGNVGREVVRAMRARTSRTPGTPATPTAGAPGTRAFRAVDADVDAVTRMHGSEIDRASLDYADPSSIERAVEGCDALFLVRPPYVIDVQTTLLPFVDAAVAQGIRHVVFLSALGASTNKLVPHHAIERHLADNGIPHTILRPCFFAQNLGAAYREDIAEDRRLYLPAGRARVAFVDIRDVAELAARIFDDPAAHASAAYTCTGPEALSFEEAARLLSDVLGRDVRYESASIAGYVRHLHIRGLPLAQIAVQTLLHVGLRFGQRDEVDGTLESLLGRRPRALAAYIRDFAELWDEPAKSEPPSTLRFAPSPA